RHHPSILSNDGSVEKMKRFGWIPLKYAVKRTNPVYVFGHLDGIPLDNQIIKKLLSPRMSVDDLCSLRTSYDIPPCSELQSVQRQVESADLKVGAGRFRQLCIGWCCT